MDILFSISAAVFFSLSHIAIRRGVSKLGVSTGTAIMLSSGALILLVIAFFFDDVHIVYAADGSSLLFFAAAGVIHFLGGWGFMNASASRIGATRVSAMASLTPLFAAILAFVALGEILNGYIVAGIGLIVMGIFMVATSKE
jgi:drug/metabolite transporter (DMT)-like permease